ncbi:hypothetical protein V3W47_09650 [Deinococcus sp. YIM 134068]|uniref:hypothetical protein n=1 Tax=Deinococcus lichenicola TaxID=3118910 RepID=UPI002F953AF6
MRAAFSRPALTRLGLLGALLAAPAHALIVPLSGWTPVDGNASKWTDPAGACLLREERHAQAFPALKNQEQARAFARRLQTSLDRGQVREVVAQPVERVGGWAVLAAYAYENAGVTYRVSQLYLSDAGKLRTVSGSSAQFEASECVNVMREFLRYGAN